jgi:hypothetical protein
MMNQKRIDKVLLPDGTLVVSTPNEGQPHFAESRAREDAELQAALDALRAAGINRPVLVQLGDGRPDSAELWKRLLPGLRQHGIPTWNAGARGPDDDRHFVLRPDQARHLLRDVLQSRLAARMFRAPQWPVSYWTVSLEGGGVAVFESCTVKDQSVR